MYIYYVHGAIMRRSIPLLVSAIAMPCNFEEYTSIVWHLNLYIFAGDRSEHVAAADSRGHQLVVIPSSCPLLALLPVLALLF